ncbi:hypothetical protein IPG37_04730 [bacterium]|nr:MAG: hypothetical protein IPG37_04730 [bacterium]
MHLRCLLIFIFTFQLSGMVENQIVSGFMQNASQIVGNTVAQVFTNVVISGGKAFYNSNVTRSGLHVLGEAAYHLAYSYFKTPTWQTSSSANLWLGSSVFSACQVSNSLPLLGFNLLYACVYKPFFNNPENHHLPDQRLIPMCMLLWRFTKTVLISKLITRVNFLKNDDHEIEIPHIYTHILKYYKKKWFDGTSPISCSDSGTKSYTGGSLMDENRNTDRKNESICVCNITCALLISGFLLLLFRKTSFLNCMAEYPTLGSLCAKDPFFYTMIDILLPIGLSMIAKKHPQYVMLNEVTSSYLYFSQSIHLVMVIILCSLQKTYMSENNSL